MTRHVYARCKTRSMDAATNRVVKESGWIENLIFDQGLNALAGDGSGTNNAGAAGIFSTCVVGSGTNPNAVSSGAITFTQAAFTLTSSAPIFTLAMVGQLFKYGTGTGGAEYYITGFTSNQIVTVDTSATVGTPTVGTIWNVAQTVLQTPLYKNSSYQTLAGNCTTTYGSNQITHQRYFVFAAQVAPYSVNEIGYGQGLSSAGSKIAGRFVLSSTDVVAPTQYYLVIMQLVVTIAPGVPTPASNVGTNINTAGALMVESIGNGPFQIVASSGAVGGFGFLEQGASPKLNFATVTYSQNGTPDFTGVGVTPTSLQFAGGPWTYQSSRGKMAVGFNASTTTTGQTLYGIGLSNNGPDIYLDVKFTTPQTAPTGLFQPKTVWTAVYDRVLSN